MLPRRGRVLRTLVRAAASTGPGPAAPKVEYKDNIIDKLFITLFSRKMAEALGGRPFDSSYDNFVGLSREIMRGRNTQQQQETVAKVLSSLLPPQAPEQFRKLFPFNKQNAEFNAWLTTIFFSWLVGPSKLQTVEVEFEGRKETWNSGVKIEKCRYLEASGCVGMCTNMCKLPTQNFFTTDFGLPLTMNPDFEDFSCEMIYGQVPPPLEQDVVYNQPCLAVTCMVGGATENEPCPKLDTDRSSKKQ